MIDALFDMKAEGPDVLACNFNGWNCLHAGVSADDVPILKKLQEKISPARLKLLISKPDKQGREPLHIAAYKCDENVVSWLMDNGADSNKEDSSGKSAVELADRSGRRKSREVMENKEGKRRNSREAVESLLPGEKGRRMSKELPEMPADLAAAAGAPAS